MPSFRYRAIDQSGHILEGYLDAASSAVMTTELERRSLLPIDIEEVNGSDPKRRASILAPTPSYEDVTALTEDLAALLTGSVALDRALQIIYQSTKRRALAGIVYSMWKVISKGHSLGEAIAAYPKAFPRTYVKMVEVAEVAGNLDVTLQVIAQNRRRQSELRHRLTSALAYPCFLIFAAIGVFFFVLIVVVPQFDQALVETGNSSRGSEPLVFTLSRIAVGNRALLAYAGAALIGAAVFVARSDAVKAALISMLRYIPGFDTLLTQQRAVVFCSTLAMLSRSGVDLPTALRLIRDLMRDKNSANLVAGVLAEVRDGSRLTDALARVDFLPPYGLQILRVGETTGEADKAAWRVASYYETKLDRSIARATAIAGPLVLLAISAFIAWIIVSVITALLSLNELLL
ncbi:MAG: type II secretion system F family protein [Ensifer adhaerens]